MDVAGVFSHSRYTPKKFMWKKRVHIVETITYVADIKNGQIPLRLYSVVSRGNVYRLEWNKNNDQWHLLEVWYEG